MSTQTKTKPLFRIASGMSQALAQARQDERIPNGLRQDMREAWQTGMLHAGSLIN